MVDFSSVAIIESQAVPQKGLFSIGGGTAHPHQGAAANAHEQEGMASTRHRTYHVPNKQAGVNDPAEPGPGPPLLGLWHEGEDDAVCDGIELPVPGTTEGKEQSDAPESRLQDANRSDSDADG